MLHEQIMKEAKRQGLTEYSLAQKVAGDNVCHFTTVYRFLLNRTSPRIEVIDACAKALGMKLEKRKKV